MATFGLLSNSVAVIIGSMLVAPLLYPLLSLALGIVIADNKLVSRSFFTLVKSSVLGIIAAAVVTWLFSGQTQMISSLIWFGDRTELISVAVAVIAGTAASFALVKPKLSETLPGIAISVAMIPPLAMIGVALAWFHWDLLANALVVFLINILGVVSSSVMVFSLMHLHHKRAVVKTAVKNDEKEIKQEEKEAKNGGR